MVVLDYLSWNGVWRLEFGSNGSLVSVKASKPIFMTLHLIFCLTGME
jgi:hypothetical protein